MGFVKGGTGTAASERLYEERFRQAEARRDQADRDHALAADAVDVTHPDDDNAVTRLPGRQGGAVEYTTQMTGHPEVPKAYVKLIYLDRAGSETGIECLSDIIVGADPALPTELTLMLVCPRCQEHSHKHQQDNQLRIRQSNKYFELRTGMGPRYFQFRDPETGSLDTYHSAGVVIESEAFSCPDCGWRARIDHNRVRPD